MKGHQGVIDTRLSGLMPARVFLRMSPGHSWVFDTDFEPHPTVEIEASDAIDLLDLRWMVQMKVSIDGGDERRMLRLFTACMGARAKRVNATLYDSRRQIIKMLDSWGELSWH